MNIFILDHDAQRAAKAYQDRHLRWGVADTAAVMTAAHMSLDGECPVTPMQVDTRHAMATWTRESSGNYRWMMDLNYCLLREFELRMRKQHHLHRYCTHLFSMGEPRNIVQRALIDFPQAIPDLYKVPRYPVLGYRNYYLSKHEGAEWSWPRKPPIWWNAMEVA